MRTVGWSAVRQRVASRSAWVVLGVIVVALLAVGANHPKAPTSAQRIDNLESILKCPACATASLAQSETVGAIELKATITRWVHEGASNQTIEQRVVADFGTDELLQQKNPWLWIVPTVAVILGVALLIRYLMRRRPTPGEISVEDEALVAELLDGQARAR